MFGVGETELAIIVVFAFLMFGPDKLPGLGRTIGRGLRQFREAQEGITKVVQVELVDPLHEAANADEGRVAGRPVSTIDDDIEDGAAQPKQVRGESFAERKARLEAERAAAEEAGEDTAPQKKAAAEPARPSAAELYGTKPAAGKKSGKATKAAKSDKAAKSGKADKPSKATKSAKSGKAAKPDKDGKTDKATKAGKSGKATKADKPAKKKSVSSKGEEAGKKKAR